MLDFVMCLSTTVSISKQESGLSTIAWAFILRHIFCYIVRDVAKTAAILEELLGLNPSQAGRTKKALRKTKPSWRFVGVFGTPYCTCVVRPTLGLQPVQPQTHVIDIQPSSQSSSPS